MTLTNTVQSSSASTSMHTSSSLSSTPYHRLEQKDETPVKPIKSPISLYSSFLGLLAGFIVGLSIMLFELVFIKHCLIKQQYQNSSNIDTNNNSVYLLIVCSLAWIIASSSALILLFVGFKQFICRISFTLNGDESDKVVLFKQMQGIFVFDTMIGMCMGTLVCTLLTGRGGRITAFQLEAMFLMLVIFWARIVYHSRHNNLTLLMEETEECPQKSLPPTDEEQIV